MATAWPRASLNAVRYAIRVSAAACVLALAPHASADWQGEIEIGTRLFNQSSGDSRNDRFDAFLAGEMSGYQDWDKGAKRIAWRAAVRWDSDDAQRNLLDLREAYFRVRKSGFELAIGVDQVFWGVTEALHLVDVINQSDLAANPDSEDKLGQPMLRLSWTPAWGTWDVYALPIFRERRFPGSAGRLRGPVRIVQAATQYESADADRHLDFAIRYSHYLGGLDFAISHFSGTARQPILVPLPVSGNSALAGSIDVAPLYFLTDQTGLEASLVTGNWLLKAEALSAREPQGRFTAVTAGVEYTLAQAMGEADLGLIAEYQYDERQSAIILAAQDDVVVGARVSLNDFAGTEVLMLASYDLDFSSHFASLEASRRFGKHWRASLESRWFVADDPRDALSLFDREDYWQLAITRFF
ncbi:MAG: hypothetical protein AAGA84_09990 [Pseudomonadota bacterium]